MNFRIGWLTGWLVAWALFIPAAIGYTQVSNVPSAAGIYGLQMELPQGLHPYVSVQEEYRSNIDLTPTNAQSDWITTVSPGVRGSLSDPKTPQYGLDVDASLGFNSYAKNSDRNFLSVWGALDTWYSFQRQLTFRLREYALRSEDPREVSYVAEGPPGQYVLATQRQRFVYFRNVFSPSVEYQFGRENNLSLNYRNNIYTSEDPAAEDSKENYINPRITYWFDIHNGMTLEYGLQLGDFETSPDLVGQMAHGRYIYRFNPTTSIFGDFVYLTRNFSYPGVDYNISNPSVGIEHLFSPTLQGSLKIGHFWQNQEIGSGTDGLSFDARLTQKTQKASFTLLGQGGYTEDFFTAENLGFVQYYRGSGVITYRLTQRTNLGFVGSVERALYPSDPSDRKDWIYGLNGNYSYLILKWLTFWAAASWRENDSNINGLDYVEYRAMVRLTAAY